MSEYRFSTMYRCWHCNKSVNFTLRTRLTASCSYIRFSNNILKWMFQNTRGTVNISTAMHFIYTYIFLLMVNNKSTVPSFLHIIYYAKSLRVLKFQSLRADLIRMILLIIWLRIFVSLSVCKYIKVKIYKTIRLHPSLSAGVELQLALREVWEQSANNI